MRGLGAAVAEGTGSGSGSVAVGECVARLRGLGAAVVEGTGSGSGTCRSWLRGLGAAVVVLQLVEGKMGWNDCICGTGCRMGFGCTCCPWCCDKCKNGGNCRGCWGYYIIRLGKKECNANGCRPQNTKCTDIHKCQCRCCRKKCQEGDSACKPLPPPPPPGPQLPDASSHVQSHSSSQQQLASSSLSTTGEQHLAGLPGVGALHSHSPKTDNSDSQSASTSSPPNPQAIAAVIVGIIVAIILLDLCIFRFPVGRNIRDFLVRKIPFCIAFYS